MQKSILINKLLESYSLDSIDRILSELTAMDLIELEADENTIFLAFNSYFYLESLN
ncbi:hypothetical protein [Aureibacter tunicatorum]|uniref:Uncharacterized protein n=1 Tax=Aureibacter tunicatorum TaxID=866807 RepID=A0AAE3XMG9_9BACT|nr:hypothetical protein [Aureibacter tunicatorum]MDR6238486.1 hypothetical protein [Aureibacter tunicatorum]